MTLYEALFGAERPRCIALVGAGGKTSAVRRMAQELQEQGHRVVITTTTKMHPPGDRSLFAETLPQVRRLLDEGKIAWAGVYFNEFKMQGIEGSLPELCRMADFVLVEADGAKKHPLKMIDRSREPVIAPETDAVVAVAGMDAVGRRAEEVLFRRALTDIGPEHIITPEDAARLLQECYAPRYVLLNKCDDDGRAALARKVAACLPGCRCVLSRRAEPLEIVE